MTTAVLDIVSDIDSLDTLASAASRVQTRRGGHWQLRDLWDATIPASYSTPQHIQTLQAALQRVADGECKRLIVVMPPRHSKSTNVSQYFPAYYLGRFPTREVILASYSLDLALEHSSKSKQLASSPEFAALFPGTMPKNLERMSAEKWMTLSGGIFKASGVGGGITGRGADVLILDDLIKGRAEADSETVRAGTIDWLRGTAYSRLSPDGAVILMGTRWHVDDPIGWALSGMADGGEQWEVIHMSATPEAPLWPERYSGARLAQIKTFQGPYEFQAQYVGEPTLRGGNRFAVDRDDEAGRPGVQVHDTDRDWPDGPWVRFWDLASTRQQRDTDSPDWTASYMACVTYRDGASVLWAKRGEGCQAEAPTRDRLIVSVAERDGLAVKQGVETVGGYIDAYNTLRDKLHGKNIVERVNVTRDKTVNAAPLEAVVLAGNCNILRDQFTEKLLQQLREFPNGKHDDFANALWGAFALASGPEERRRVFDAVSIWRSVRYHRSQPQPHSEIRVGLAYSPVEGHRLVAASLDGAMVVVFMAETIRGGPAALAERCQALGLGGQTAMVTVLDGSDSEMVLRELRLAGVACRDGSDTTQGINAIQQLLEAQRLVIPDELSAVAHALEQFHRARDVGVEGVSRDRHVWSGDGGFVRALIDATSQLRFRETSDPKPQRQDVLPTRVSRKPLNSNAPGKGLFF